MARAKPEWRTQSVLLPKVKFPTKPSAAAWLRAHGYRADLIEDSAIKPGGLPAGSGHFWRGRQTNPRGRVTRMLPLGTEGIMLVRELQP